MIYSKTLNFIFDKIEKNGGKAMLVGGCVRDFLLNNTPIETGDIDIAVSLPVNRVAEIFKKSGAKVVTKYATNIVVLNGKAFELTSTRKDINHDGRYAEMIFTPSFEEDSRRRDFTINALYLDKTGCLFDFHNGQKDLKEKRVRFIGEPDNRIEEDYLRIWRFFRFSAHYADQIDERGLESCSLKKEGLNIISKERVTYEMLKLLTASPLKINYILREMTRIGILSKESFFLNENLPIDPFLRFLTLTHGGNIPFFLYTAKQKRLLKQYHAFRLALNKKSYIYYLYYTLPLPEFQNILNVAEASKELPFKKDDFQNLPPLPFSYASIIDQGFRGSEISDQFKSLLWAFINNLLQGN